MLGLYIGLAIGGVLLILIVIVIVISFYRRQVRKLKAELAIVYRTPNESNNDYCNVTFDNPGYATPTPLAMNVQAKPNNLRTVPAGSSAGEKNENISTPVTVQEKPQNVNPEYATPSGVSVRPKSENPGYETPVNVNLRSSYDNPGYVDPDELKVFPADDKLEFDSLASDDDFMVDKGKR
ncbi:uncharacterized protein LOC112041271 [Lingula anatina]|uniref:Uncharacterized protein LOC112041271 n=1 Tax=Lingula anatina TaxID=7574 RepID=A0A2R2MIA5_LINAN|nr:uncharacterized protein LOC112041271 [Lingula anatina]|eukprot:XP_023929943.1 uncharacterized protein LOC112041271 [Lingula anatina]